MTFGDLCKIYSMYDIIIYVNRVKQEIKSDMQLSKYYDYEVRQIKPICVASDICSITMGVTIRPYLEIYLIKKD